MFEGNATGYTARVGASFARCQAIRHPVQAPGAGITTSLLQFHGSADLYTAQAGTRTVAALSPGGQPAVSLRTVGAGHAAAFTYDLARSIVYTRQGNPSWVGQNRDMLAFGPSPDSLARSNDLFFGGDPLDPQPDWTDLNRVAVPQADEQQRLLANMIIQYSITPTPRFWRRGTATRSPPWGARDTCGPRAGA